MKKMLNENIFKIEPYQPGKRVEALKREMDIEGEVIQLCSNENPLGPSPMATDAIRKCLREGNCYPDTTCHELREKLAHHMRVTPENIKVGNGITGLFLPIGLAFLNRGENVVMSSPSFMMMKQMTNLLGKDLIEVSLKNHRHDLETILESVNGNTKIVYLDNPNNPIGTIVTDKEIASFIEKIPPDTVIVFDEAYFEYVSRVDFPDTINYVREQRDVIVLRTFSKLYGLAGFRVGYSVARKDFINAIIRANAPFSVNHFAQVAASAALEDLDHVDRTRAINERGKRFLYECFDEMSVSYIPSEANFVTIDVKTDASKIFDRLQDKGVVVRTLATYDEPTLLRITVGTPEENERFIEALKKIIHVEV